MQPRPQGASTASPDPERALPLLRATDLLAPVPDAELAALVPRLRLATFAAGDTVIRAGEPGDAWYLLVSGRIGVLGRDLRGQEATVAELAPGDHFGEVALVSGGPRDATARALEPSEAYVLDRADFLALEAVCPELHDRVNNHVDRLAASYFLREASPFAHLPDETLRLLAGQLERERFAAGQTVVREGDPGDRFYLVQTGRLEVVRAGQRLRQLEAGDFFGEVALLADVPRTATVLALEESALLSLDKADFDAVVSAHATVQRQMTEYVRIRVGDALARSIAAVDPLKALMPQVGQHRRHRYWWMLLGGLVAFALLTALATQTHQPLVVYGAVVVGAFLGPVVYVVYLYESELLPERPIDLAVAFLLAAALGIPLAMRLSGLLGGHTGELVPALLVGLAEEPSKVAGVAWLLWRSRSRFRMDGVVYGAAAGMGFAAFENLLYGYRFSASVSDVLSTLWVRALLSPFGHGTWTAILCAAIWRAKGAGRPRLDLPVLGAFALAVGLHGLWDWQPIQGPLLIGWFVFVGVLGLEVLQTVIERARGEEAAALLAINPELATGGIGAAEVVCRACGDPAPAGARYCARCGAALRT